MKFRKKPVIVDAIQWDGENEKEVLDFLGPHSQVTKMVSQKGNRVLHVIRPDGTLTVRKGNWIVKGVNGKYLSQTSLKEITKRLMMKKNHEKTMEILTNKEFTK